MAAYTVDATLAHVRPRIWRRLRVPGDLPLPFVHEMLQVAFGWEDCHLHEFRIGDERYAPVDEEGHTEALDEAELTIATALPSRTSTMQYIYDPGDCWIHTITVHDIEVLAEHNGRRGRLGDVHALTCVAGKRARPPEDCGGPSGYADFLKAVASPTHPRHQEMLAWVGGAFDPEAISLSEINRALSTLV